MDWKRRAVHHVWASLLPVKCSSVLSMSGRVQPSRWNTDSCTHVSSHGPSFWIRKLKCEIHRPGCWKRGCYLHRPARARCDWECLRSPGLLFEQHGRGSPESARHPRRRSPSASESTCTDSSHPSPKQIKDKKKHQRMSRISLKCTEENVPKVESVVFVK